MPRDWGEIIQDPTPSVVFEPISESSSLKVANSRSIPTFSAIRQAIWKSRTARLHISILIVAAGFIGGVSGGIYGGWYLFSDVFFSTIAGLTVAVLTLLTPEIMVTIASGSIAVTFCMFTFGTYGRETQLILTYFSFGCCFGVVVQIARYAILTTYQKNLVRVDQEPLASGVERIES